MVFERADDLESLWYTHDMVATTSQMGFEHHRYDKLLTLRSTRCGRVLKYHDGVEDGTPGLMLHLEKGPHENLGDMIIVNVASRHLSSFGIRRHLDRLMAQGQYCDTFSRQKNSVSLIGGDVGESLFLDHYQERRNNGFHLFSGEMGSEISVFARADDEIEYSSYTMTDDADITVLQLWRSATYDTGAHWTLEEEITSGSRQMMEVPRCEQRRQQLAKGLPGPVILALNDVRRISNNNLLGARQTELRSIHDAAHQLRLGDAPRRLQLPDADSDSEEPPVKDHPRDFDFRSPRLKANLKAKTPIWDNFVENLSTVTSNAHVREFIEFLRTECFTKPELLWTNANGDHLPFELPLSLKMEQLLETAQDRRMHGLKKVESGYDLTDVRQVETILDETYEFSELEMKELWQLRLLSDVF